MPNVFTNYDRAIDALYNPNLHVHHRFLQMLIHKMRSSLSGESVGSD